MNLAVALTQVAMSPLAVLPSPSPTASVQFVTPPPVDKTGVGGIGFLIVLALLAVSVGLFFAMRGSLRRLNQRDLDGSFGTKGPAAPAPPGS